MSGSKEFLPLSTVDCFTPALGGQSGNDLCNAEPASIFYVRLCRMYVCVCVCTCVHVCVCAVGK